MQRSRVVVGLSGGVDSAVSAWLLKRQGHEVVGLFMKNWEDDDDDEHCTSRQDFLDAAAVADLLGIELEHVNFAAEYKDRVFAEFLREYSAGRTPNPDVLCNAEIKFKAFLDHALALGAEAIATGHYARVRVANPGMPVGPHDEPRAAARGSARVRIADPGMPVGPNDEPRAARGSPRVRWQLLKGLDPSKDQSYFLHRLTQAQLARTRFPVGELKKAEVRRIAAELRLPVAAKRDSTGICFIGERPFREFLQRYLAHRPGPIEDERGRVVGQHVGLSFYTLGQRQGLGIGGLKPSRRAKGGAEHAPWYVAGKDLSRNALRVVQGHDHPALLSSALLADGASWIGGSPPPPGRYAAKTRYRQADAACALRLRDGDAFELAFDAPQWAATPGQSAVLYDGEVCLGGGFIASTFSAARSA